MPLCREDFYDFLYPPLAYGCRGTRCRGIFELLGIGRQGSLETPGQGPILLVIDSRRFIMEYYTRADGAPDRNAMQAA